MRRRLVLAVTLLASVLVLLGSAAASEAAPGALKILFTANQMSSISPALISAIRGEPGVATVDTFDTSTATPSAATLATYDLVVSTGDSCYADNVAWGNELAAYLDAGGALIQFAYDNWNHPCAVPAGTFASGGYAPFVPGPNQNTSTTLGTILQPNNPLLTGVSTLSTTDNTTDALAPGATLLALWADGRNAIATKGRVESVTTALDSGGYSPDSTIAQLVVNAGNVLGRHALSVSKTGTGSGTVSSTDGNINCGSTCSFTYSSGTTVTLNATPASGSTFAGWSGGGCSGTGSCTVTMSSNQSVTATFNLSAATCTDTAGAYNQGYNSGFNSGFQRGFKVGYHIGYTRGFAAGFGSHAIAATPTYPACNAEFNQGFQTAFSKGFIGGFKSGFKSGFKRGFNVGWTVRHRHHK
jgi:hypothetical protein